MYGVTLFFHHKEAALKALSRLFPLLTVLCLLLAACGSTATGTNATPTVASTPTPTPTPVTLNVFAAASLSKVFAEIGTQFQNAHPGVTIKFNFAGSQALATQITSGAPVDVF